MSKRRSRHELLEPALTAYARGEPEQFLALDGPARQEPVPCSS